MKEERQKHLKKKDSLQNVDIKKKSALGTLKSSHRFPPGLNLLCLLFFSGVFV